MNVNRPANLREKKQAATREALYRASFALFAEKGFEATTVDEIAERAGVSRRTFFRYFESKESVVFAKQPNRMERFRELVAANQHLGGFEAVVRASLALGPEFEEERDEAVLAQSFIQDSPALFAADAARDLAWEQAIAEALANGSDAVERQRMARYVAGAILGLIRATMREWRRPDGPENLTEIAERNLRLLGLGLAAALGDEAINGNGADQESTA